MDTRTFQYDNNTSGLNLIHLRCDLPVDLQRDNPLKYGLVAPGTGGSGRGNAYTEMDTPTPPSMSDTDFEQPLDVQFYITEKGNFDWSWQDDADFKPSEEEAKLEVPPDYSAGMISVQGKPTFGTDMNDPWSEGGQKKNPQYLVGRYAFLKYRSEPRKFKWKMHKDDKAKQVCRVIQYHAAEYLMSVLFPSPV